METMTAIEYELILEGLERVARNAPTPDDRAIADMAYAKVVNLVVRR